MTLLPQEACRFASTIDVLYILRNLVISSTDELPQAQCIIPMYGPARVQVLETGLGFASFAVLDACLAIQETEVENLHPFLHYLSLSISVRHMRTTPSRDI